LNVHPEKYFRIRMSRMNEKRKPEGCEMDSFSGVGNPWI